jgi:hypothetical protein
VTLKELFQRFRSEVDDNETPFLWSDSDLESYFNRALEKLAKDAKYFLDRTTWEGLTVTADSGRIAADSANKLDRILFIRRAVLVSNGRPLKTRTMLQSDEAGRNDDYGKRFSDGSNAWETATGVPQILVTDYYEDGSLRLGPIPTAADSINLWAFRLPLRYYEYTASQNLTLKELTGIKEYEHEMTLLQGMKAYAYLKDDPETRDDTLATASMSSFETALENISRELSRRRHPAGTVRYGGL